MFATRQTYIKKENNMITKSTSAETEYKRLILENIKAEHGDIIGLNSCIYWKTDMDRINAMRNDKGTHTFQQAKVYEWLDGFSVIVVQFTPKSVFQDHALTQQHVTLKDFITDDLGLEFEDEEIA